MGKRRTGLNPLAYMGVEATSPPMLVVLAQAPTANDTNFNIGTMWVDTSTDSIYWLSSLDGSVATWSSLTMTNGTNGQLLIGGGSAAAWANLTSTGGSVTITEGANSINLEAAGVAALTSLDGDSGTATPVAGVIVIAGGTNITTVGGSDTLTINMDASPSVAGSLTAATTITAGTNITSTAGNIAASSGNVSASGTVTSGTTMTCGSGFTVSAGGIDSTGTTTLQDLGDGVVLSSAAGVLSDSAGNNGQLIIGSTGSTPAWASVTSSGSTITITEGANTLNLEAASTPWTVSAIQETAMTAGTNYIGTYSGAGEADYKLPATAAVGDTFRVTGGLSTGTETMRIIQNASQWISDNSNNTTTGSAGWIRGGALEVVCTETNVGFRLISSAGSLLWN